MAITKGTEATLFTSSTTSDVPDAEYESNSITPTSDTESLIVALISLTKDNTGDSLSFTSVTFGTASRTFGTGTAMTVEETNDGGNANPCCAIAWLKTDATGTVQIDVAIDIDAAILGVYQFKGVDQTTPVPTGANENSNTSTGNNIAITTANANAWIIALSNSKGNDTGPPAATNGTTLHTGSTGSTGFSDNKDAASYRAVVSAGATTANFTWGNSNRNAQCVIELKPATGAGSQDLTPSLVASEESFPGPTITTGAVDLTPGLSATEEAFFSPFIGHGLTVAFVTTEEGFFGPTITTGVVDLTPALVASEELFPSAVVTAGAVTLTPSLVTTEELFFGPSIGHGITAALVTTEEQFFSATVSPGAITLTPALSVTEEQFFAPTVTQDGAEAQDIQPGLTATEEQFFSATFTTGAVTLAPSLGATEEQFFAPSVIPIIAPGLMASEEQFFGPSVAVGAVSLLPGLMTSEEAFFAATVARTEIFSQNQNRTVIARRPATNTAARGSTVIARRAS